VNIDVCFFLRTSAEFGTTWVRILNDFHTESYFIGVRTEDDRFLADSRLFPSWSYPSEPSIASTEKTVTGFIRYRRF
jgi:hypothetical protein